MSDVATERNAMMDKDTALKVCELADALLSKAADLLDVVNNSALQEERGTFLAVLATVIGEVDLEILEPVYKQYPELRPPSLDAIK
jgi:hypothetical protein